MILIDIWMCKVYTGIVESSNEDPVGDSQQIRVIQGGGQECVESEILLNAIG